MLDFPLSQIADLVSAKLGLYFPKERWHDLQRGIELAARDLGFADVESCVHDLISHPLQTSQLEILAAHLTVGETYFFRDKSAFSALETAVLPELINARRHGQKHLRIWSAGCCTGEEPYSIAILLKKMLADLDTWSITILATDINPWFLKKASAGAYTDWSFRDTPKWMRQKYFLQCADGRFEVPFELRKMVTFSSLNLAGGLYPSPLNNSAAMDLILCRNVLMYFAPEQASRVMDGLRGSLAEGGWLLVGQSETSHVPRAELTTVKFPGVVFYRKAGSQPRDLPSVQSHQAVLRNPDFPPGEQSSALTSSLKSRHSKPSPGTDAHRDSFVESRTSPLLHDAGSTVHEYRSDTENANGTPPILHEANDANALACLARLHANQGKLTEALFWCEKAITADKLNPIHRYLLAAILQEQARYEEAVDSLKQALYLNPNFVLAHFMLGSLARQGDKLKEAGRHFQNALFLLRAYAREEVLPEGGGITAGRLAEMIDAML
jgi:chemotaxis protein methyltransferase CheR